MIVPSTDAAAKRTLMISSLATLATFLDTTILYVAFPDIRRTFAATEPSTLAWVLNAYTIVFAALLIPAGKLADRLGHRRMFLAGSMLFTVASMACGLAPTAPLLVLFRIVQAAGAATLIPSSLALVMHAYPRERLPRAVAIWGATGAVAGALGPTLGSAIIEGAGWRWAFYINVPVGLVTVALGRRTLRESSDPSTPVPSMIGVGLITAAAGLLCWAVLGTSDMGWAAPRTIGLLVTGTLVLGVFLLHQRSTDRPALDLDLFRIRDVRRGIAAMFVIGVAFSAMFLGSILYLTQAWHWSIVKAGFGVAPGPLLVAVLAPRFGRLAGRIGQRPILLAGGLVFAVAGLHRMVVLGAEPHYVTHYLPSMLLTGLGVAACLPQLSSLVAQALPPNRIGVGGAALQATRQLGGTFGVALTVAFLGTPTTIQDALARFDRVWWILIIGGLGTTAVFANPAVRRREPVSIDFEDRELS